ncbi:hypothetical protein AMK59_7105 [Oryctes borbonicus]|uniref:Uncharacterized protein n=1 Tax=Oryctes borbonicus TaxID=1629725 RepID=A0A0T6AV19_9SCAR|nr:hypothetical protein AMK59_7105 [Oryctes borbonicus]
MAVLAAAQLLDELMGRNRNVAPHEKVKELNWEDSEYCKYFMVKFCPHDLFVNTRADLGTCAKVHDEEARKLFSQAKNHRKIHYQEEFVRFCSSMLNEVERKIQKGKQRLALSGKGEVTSLSPAQTQRNTEQINLLNERINGLVEEAEQAGTDGNVEQAQGLMKLCDQLKEERDALKTKNENSHWSTTAEIAAAQEKQMEVCEVCGAFLIVGDAQQRIDDHLMGKQHVGYAKLKIAIEEISAAVQTAREERRGGRTGGLGSTPTVDDRRDRDRRSHESRRDRDRDRSRERIRDRSELRSEREKERSCEHRERDRDRDRKERNDRKDREKEKLDRKEKDRRDKEREKDRDRKHRSDRDAGRDSRSSRHSSHRR